MCKPTTANEPHMKALKTVGFALHNHLRANSTWSEFSGLWKGFSASMAFHPKPDRCCLCTKLVHKHPRSTSRKEDLRSYSMSHQKCKRHQADSFRPAQYFGVGQTSHAGACKQSTACPSNPKTWRNDLLVNGGKESKWKRQNVLHSSVVFSKRSVQNDTNPISRSKFCLASKADLIGCSLSESDIRTAGHVQPRHFSFQCLWVQCKLDTISNLRQHLNCRARRSEKLLLTVKDNQLRCHKMEHWGVQVTRQKIVKIMCCLFDCVTILSCMVNPQSLSACKKAVMTQRWYLDHGIATISKASSVESNILQLILVGKS